MVELKSDSGAGAQGGQQKGILKGFRKAKEPSVPSHQVRHPRFWRASGVYAHACMHACGRLLHHHHEFNTHACKYGL